MTTKIIFRARISKGHVVFIPEDKELFNQRLLELEGQDVELTIERPSERHKGNGYKRYYWGVVVKETANYLGYSKDRMHIEWKRKFLTITNVPGVAPTVRSTTTLTDDEWRDYIDDIKKFMLDDYNFTLPERDRVEIT